MVDDTDYSLLIIDVNKSVLGKAEKERIYQIKCSLGNPLRPAKYMSLLIQRTKSSASPTASYKLTHKNHSKTGKSSWIHKKKV